MHAMGNLLLRWLILVLSVIAASYFTRVLGLNFVVTAEGVSGFLQLMIGVAVLALLNATLGTVLKLLTLPLTCLTLGLFSLVINAAILMWSASFGLGYQIGEDDGSRKFMAAFVASLLISAVNAILGSILIKDEDRNKDE